MNKISKNLLLKNKINVILNFYKSQKFDEVISRTKPLLKKLPKFDHVLLLGILHHLNDAEVNALMLLLKKTLKKKGNIITVDNIFSKKQREIFNADNGKESD